jgi:myo-inositol 2-dehydrogenase/D-chiro-inositol 1-dehydrogenase
MAAVAQAGVLCMIGFQRRFDPTFMAVKERLVAGQIGSPEMLIVTSRDPGAPPVGYLASSGGIFKDMLIHDFDICRWILDDEALSVHATGSCLVDPAIGAAGDLDCTAVTIRTTKGRLCQINTSRRAAYGYDQRFEILGSAGMLQAGNHKPTEVTAFTGDCVSQDKPEHFFLERYRAAYANEMAHFFDAINNGTRLRTTVEDGLKALELAEAATLSWRERRVVHL